MPRSREVPFAPIPSTGKDGETMLREPRGVRVHNVRADTEWGALMVCAPHIDPEWSRDRLLPLRDLIQDALETLTERERYVFDAIVVERLSLRSASSRMSLSKSQVDRVYKAACEKLRDHLDGDPTVKEYLFR